MIFKKIGIDFHGVIHREPEFFKRFVEFAVAKGYEIYIVSGGPRQTIIDFLAAHKIPYHHLWCIIDQPEINENTTFCADGSFRVNDMLWDKAKGEYCQNEGINLHIDDSVVYGKYFTTPYCRFDADESVFICNGKCFTANMEISELLENLQIVTISEC
ncbi:MAG: hypothetical protein IJ099_00275 [Alphaproteobacteria bacterium]|nr:hypothetical protein [Alphaproteobacteria bacterium]